MPEVAPVVAAPVPSATTQAKPAASVASTTRAIEPAPVAETSPTPPSESDLAQRFRRLEAEHAKKVREQIIERRKWDADRKQTGERLSRLSELEKREQQAKLNPTAHLKSLYGDDWHQVVTDAKINGVPPAQLVEAEMARMREEFDARLKARDDEGAKSLHAQQQRQLEQARANIRGEAEEWYDAAGKDYPVLERLGDKAVVARTIAARIEREFHATSKSDESGNVVRQGRVLTAKEAADIIEDEMLMVAEAALKAEKYRARLAPKPPDLTPEKKSGSLNLKQQPTGQQQSVNGQQRKSLSNDITGSTKDETRPPTPQERRQRALDAYNAARKSKAATN